MISDNDGQKGARRMNQNDYLIYYVWMIVVAILGSALLIPATEKEGIATVGGAIIFVACWLALKTLGCL
jgi:hypothetical protein